MEKLAKQIALLGNKAVGLITISISSLAIIAGFLWQQQGVQQHFETQLQTNQQQTAVMLNLLAASRIDNLFVQLEAIATSPDIVSLVINNDQDEINKQQQYLSTLFPHVEQVCMIDVALDDVDPKACIPITFAALHSLRQAKQKDVAPIALIGNGTEKAHLLLAHSIKNNADQVVGVLLVTLKPTALTGVLSKTAGFKGYIELHQGKTKVTVLDKQGDANQKQGNARFVLGLENTHWRLAYWPEKNTVAVTSSLVVLGIVVLLVVLMWWLKDAFKAYLLKRDVATLKQELKDFQNGSLKRHYHMAFPVLKTLVNDIAILARKQFTSNAKKGATAESLDKKVVEAVEMNGPEYPELETVELDDLELPEQNDTPALDIPVEKETVSEGIKFNLSKTSSPELLDVAANIDPVIFRAYDIRGIVGENLTEESVKSIGHAIGSEAIDKNVNQLMVGRDGRLSSESLTNALIEGIVASGCNVTNLGEVPTPVVYFACEQQQTYSGVMVTGSHNPAEYNGLKVVLAGNTLAEDSLQALHRRIETNNLKTGQGSVAELSIIDEYIERIVSDITISRPIKIVIDCGNGIAGVVAPALFKALGCEVIELFCEVDGNFPNHHPDPSQPENLYDLSEAVKKHGAELGFAFDGDGDRLGVVDSQGKPVWPDKLMMLFAKDVLSRLPGSVIMYDVKSSSLLGEEIADAGGEPVMWKSGHSLIKNRMKELDIQLAGEFSGHIFFKERWYGFDDGTYAASRLLELLSGDLLQRTAQELFDSLPSYVSTPEIRVSLPEGESKQFMRRVAAEGRFDGAELSTIDGLRADYLHGWGLVRASNTIPGLTLRFEADSEQELHNIQQLFKEQLLRIKPTLTLLF